jgi:alpha-L-fucosidase
LLNIAPGPEGQWRDEAYQLLEKMGAWMKINSEAIYGTRAIAPYKEGKVCLTSKGEDTMYLIYLADENEHTLPPMISLSTHCPEEGAMVSLLGSKGVLNWKKNGNGFIVEIPESLQKRPPCKDAWVVKVSF